MMRGPPRHIYALRNVGLGYAGRIDICRRCFSSKLPVSPLPSVMGSGLLLRPSAAQSTGKPLLFFWRSVLDAFFCTGLIVYMSLHCLKIEPSIRDTPASQFPSFRRIMDQSVRPMMHPMRAHSS
jgi:hypothetical protein